MSKSKDQFNAQREALEADHLALETGSKITIDRQTLQELRAYKAGYYRLKDQLSQMAADQSGRDHAVLNFLKQLEQIGKVSDNHKEAYLYELANDLLGDYEKFLNR